MTMSLAHPPTVSRRAAMLRESGLDHLMPCLTAAGVEFDVEAHARDYVLTIYTDDDAVVVVTGHGVDQYDVTRYDLPEWQDVHGEPDHEQNGLTRWAAALVAMDVRTLPRVA